MAFWRSRKFRVDILTIFITLFLTSILGITAYFYERSNDAVLKVANGFINRTIDSITQRLHEFMQPMPLFGIANLIMNDMKLDTSDMDALASYMHVVLKSYPQLVNAYIADTNGNLFIENRILQQPAASQFIPFLNSNEIPGETQFISVMLSQLNTSANAKFVYKNESGKIIKTSRLTQIKFDARSRPWYERAKAGGKSMWIGIYPFYHTPVQVLTIAFPIYVNNQFMGVAAADLKISAIKEAMKRFSIDAKGVVFIANHHGQVIAYDKTVDENPASVTSVYTTDNPLIKKAYQMHMQLGEDNFIFSLNGISYITYFKKYIVSANEKWDIAVIVPLDVFVGSLNEANRRVLIFSLTTLVLGLLLVIICSNRISKPIISIAAETQDMQHFNFEKVTYIHSYIYEVQVMVNAINVAKSALSSFAKYVPKTLVEQLLKLGTIAAPGGQKKKITVLFTDIRGFTSISEGTDPNLLLLYLSEYLNIMTQCIHRHHGNIDKYIGDSIMAFWGAPLDDAQQIHHACLAVLACRHETRFLSEHSAAHAKPVFHTRFGLNTGDAIVGNLGSHDRLNYTAIGDVVNTASRLEQTNKIYGTEIIVSDEIHAVCANAFLFRPIDRIEVKGKKESMQIYELMAENAEGKYYPATQQQLELCSNFIHAYRLYHDKKIQQALDLLLIINEKFPEDTLTQWYIKRCHDFLS